jgi:hypothetical protein
MAKEPGRDPAGKWAEIECCIEAAQIAPFESCRYSISIDPTTTKLFESNRHFSSYELRPQNPKDCFES